MTILNIKIYALDSKRKETNFFSGEKMLIIDNKVASSQHQNYFHIRCTSQKSKSSKI